MALNPGSMSHQVIVRDPVIARAAGSGAATETWPDKGTLFVSLDALTAREQYAMGRIGSTRTWVARTWANDLITMKSRLVDGTRTFQVVGLRPVDDLGMELEVTLEEVPIG
jgi:SPP1 family predicted phage head-tail adaptor